MSGLEYIVQQVVNAVSLGSLYALVAVGLSIVFGVLRLTNFAHGDVMMVGPSPRCCSTRSACPSCRQWRPAWSARHWPAS